MTNYPLLSFILRGGRRKSILLCLDKPKIPKEIAKECNLSIHNVSKSLKELSNKSLISCKNPKDKFYRFYELTKKGRKLTDEIKPRL